MDQLNITGSDLQGLANITKTGGNLYEVSQELNDAVKIAILLNKPLLITGEPGTGKTKFAEKVAADLSLVTENRYNPKPYMFTVKSNSVYTDLFYTYDAVGHFYDANIKKSGELALEKYISLNALGFAIVASMQAEDKANVPARNRPAGDVPPNSVVLIDEIDKAPRDFPNDILNELDTYSFNIKEAGMKQYTKGNGAHILVVMTSNRERDLPDAFLRRCVFFQIAPPDRDFLLKVLDKHALLAKLNGKYDAALDMFFKIRDACTFKKPATAELIDWCKVLVAENTDLTYLDKVITTLPALVKDDTDKKTVIEKSLSSLKKNVKP